jgi:putative transposase
VHRGNDGIDIFRSESDYLYMRRCLEEGGVGRGVALHSYVMMTNHVHLLLTADDDTGISRLMQSAARRYVAYFNRKYERTGTLWEGRFFSAVVTTDYYLMACHRYIDLNPVRAGLSRGAAGYRWSSHRHYAFGTGDPLISEHPVIVALANDDGRRRSAYRSLFASELPQSDIETIRAATRGRRPLGGAPASSAQRRGHPPKKVSDTN